MLGWLSAASTCASRWKRATPLGVLRERRGQHLDRDVAVELRVARAIDLAHAARADGAGDLVGADPGVPRPAASEGGYAPSSTGATDCEVRTIGRLRPTLAACSPHCSSYRLDCVPEALLGPHSVGFRVLGARDASRRLEGAARPVQMGVWYPAAGAPGRAAGVRRLRRARGGRADARSRHAGAGARRARRVEAVPDRERCPGAGARRVAAPRRRSRAPKPRRRRAGFRSCSWPRATARRSRTRRCWRSSSPRTATSSPRSPSQDPARDVDRIRGRRPAERSRAGARSPPSPPCASAPLPFVDARQLAFVGHSFGARSALLAALQEPRTVAPRQPRRRDRRGHRENLARRRS